MGKRDVWDFYENLDEESRDGLSATELAVAAVCDLRQEVNAHLRGHPPPPGTTDRATGGMSGRRR